MTIPVDIHVIGKRRFDAFMTWARGTGVLAPTTEVEWLEIPPAKVLAAVFVDQTDKDLNGTIIAPDLAGRYRTVETVGSFTGIDDVMDATAASMVRVLRNYDEARTQGDEKPAVDFFAGLAKENKLHPLFKHLRDDAGAVAARRLIEVAMRWYENQDGTFVEQFQTTAYDARIWELYIWAVLREVGYAVQQPKPAPDFLARDLAYQFYVEATTANPPPPSSAVPLPRTESEIDDYVHSYLPTRFSGPLCAKLQKKYWERDEVDSTIPFVIAVQDFHQPLSMTWSQSALFEYLYGVRIETIVVDGIKQKAEVPVSTLTWGTKEIESGFFNLPGSEHVSAVMFNAAGTLSKFNRMGIAAGMGDSNVTVVHTGTRFAKDNSAQEEQFEQPVTVDYAENWVDGLTVFHNPKALHPLSFDALPGAAHVYEENGAHQQCVPAGHLVSTMTEITVIRDDARSRGVASDAR